MQIQLESPEQEMGEQHILLHQTNFTLSKLNWMLKSKNLQVENPPFKA